MNSDDDDEQADGEARGELGRTHEPNPADNRARPIADADRQHRAEQAHMNVVC